MSTKRALALLLLTAAATAGARGQSATQSERVAGNVWRIDGAVDTIVVQTGPDGTLMVDTGYPFAVDGVKARLREIAGNTQIARLIDTHSHHGFSNDLYGAGAEIIAHENAARRMTFGFLMAGQAIPPNPPDGRPQRTFANSLRLRMNGEDITLLHLPGAHTDGDIAVIFHGSNVVAAGDAVVPHMPWISLNENGSLDGLLGAFDTLLEVIPEGARIVPGHDPVTLEKDDLRALRTMLATAADTVRSRMAQGLSLRRIQALGLPELAKWRGPVPERMFIESLYRAQLPVRTNPDAGSLELVNGRWWDGSGFQARTVYAVDGVFVADRPARIDRRLDLDGGWVVPPFGEAHTHRFGNAARLDDDARDFLREGVFYAMVQDPMSAVGPRHRALSARADAPDVAFTQGAITPSWGAIAEMYGTLAADGVFGQGVSLAALNGDILFIVDNTDDLARFWPAIVARNDRFLKVIVAFSDQIDVRRADPDRFRLRMEPPRSSGKAGVTPEVLRALVGRAHEAGLIVSAHIETAADFRLAVASGVDWIAHMPAAWQIGDGTGYAATDTRPWLFSPEDAQAARMAGTVVSTTLSGTASDPRAELFKEVHRKNLGLLVDTGVTLALGSDNFEGTAVDEALYLRSLNVLSDAQLLTLLANQTPQLIFPDFRIGNLRPGYEASFLVLNGDPTDELANIRDIRLAVKRGTVLARGQR